MHRQEESQWTEWRPSTSRVRKLLDIEGIKQEPNKYKDIKTTCQVEAQLNNEDVFQADSHRCETATIQPKNCPHESKWPKFRQFSTWKVLLKVTFNKVHCDAFNDEN